MSRADVYDEARHNLQEARSRLQNIHESTNRVLAGLVGDPQLPAERHPRFLEAKAALRCGRCRSRAHRGEGADRRASSPT